MPLSNGCYLYVRMLLKDASKPSVWEWLKDRNNCLNDLNASFLCELGIDNCIKPLAHAHKIELSYKWSERMHCECTKLTE